MWKDRGYQFLAIHYHFVTPFCSCGQTEKGSVGCECWECPTPDTEQVLSQKNILETLTLLQPESKEKAPFSTSFNYHLKMVSDKC